MSAMTSWRLPLSSANRSRSIVCSTRSAPAFRPRRIRWSGRRDARLSASRGTAFGVVQHAMANDTDRRHPHVTISDLRRDLRDADQAVFALRARMYSGAGPHARGRAVVFSLALIVPIASAVYGLTTSRAPRADRVEVAVSA